MSNTRNAGRKPKGKSARRPAQIKSLTRALALIETISQSDRGLTMSELARSVKLAPSTAHRLLNSLLAREFVDFDHESGIWTVGLQAFIVGNAYLINRDVVAVARPIMRRLKEKTGETVNLAVLQNEHVVFVGQVESAEEMRMVVQIGSRGPIHATGVGKALLSALPENEVIALARKIGMPRLTQNTITTITKLKQALRQIREVGFAVDDEEQKVGLRCIAANICNQHGEAIVALSISGPTVRVSKAKVALLAQEVVDAAQTISELIGGHFSANSSR